MMRPTPANQPEPQPKSRFHLALLPACAVLLTALGTPQAAAQEPGLPNIVLIYADDVGYGDLSCYGSTKIQTPMLDKLAGQGARFTSAYCTSSTCTPSRYSILTGEYAFRNPRARILQADMPILIDPDTVTLPEVLRRSGYKTAVIGKWHLGMGDGDIDWNAEVKPGPLEVGFDHSFVIPATNDRVPTVWMNGHQVHNWSADDPPLRVSYRQKVGDLPTGESHPELLRYGADPQHSGTIVNGISRIGYMDGGQSAWWDDEGMVHEITSRCEEFIRQNRQQPFFLFMAMHENHVPRLPHPDFIGKSETGLRGDAVVELDWAVGRIMATLDELDLRENTLIIFSSDNGPIFFDGYFDGSAEDADGHRPSGPFRGGKYHVFEGGTRMPTIVSWPGRVEPGTVSDAMLSQVDLFASLAALVGAEIPEGAAPDSEDHLAAWLGESEQGRSHVVQQGTADGIAIRSGDWKLIPGVARLGWGNKHNQFETALSTQMPPQNRDLLFNLAEDPGETNDLAAEYPEMVRELKDLLDSILQGDPR